MRKKIVKIVSVILLTGCVSMLSGCFSTFKETKLKRIKGDIKCEFRVGKNAGTLSTVDPVDTDVVFDKDEFVDLYNEDIQYNPLSLKYHLEKFDLRIEPGDEDLKDVMESEVSIGAVYDGQTRKVSVYEYDSKLYFFVLCMGSRSEPGEEGYYYMEVPEDMAEYWEPLIEEVREDAEKEHKEKYGSFTKFKSYSYDDYYYVDILGGGGGDNYMISVGTAYDNMPICSIDVIPKDEFRGFCWENDNYNLWIQTVDGVVCYSMEDDEWSINEDAVKPDYIIEKED